MGASGIVSLTTLSYSGHHAALFMAFSVFFVGMLLGFTDCFVFSKGTGNLVRFFLSF
jgi:hypothetical protein